MSVQWTVARAVGFGLIKDGLPFVRTAKGGFLRRNGGDFPAFWEAVIGALLVASAIFLHATNWERVREIDLFALVLVVQSLPFLASVALAALEGTRVNDFAALARPRGAARGTVAWSSRRRLPPRFSPERAAGHGREAGRDRAIGFSVPERLPAQRGFHQLDPIRRADRDHLVVEIVWPGDAGRRCRRCRRR